MLQATCSILLAVLAATPSSVFGQNQKPEQQPSDRTYFRGLRHQRNLRVFEDKSTDTNTNTNTKNNGRIVGGDQSTPGDFPYFVEMGGCGGALIASDIVLFAAHCGSFKDRQVNVGSYTRFTTNHNSQPRFCEKWIADPLHNTGGGYMNYDFALCKLDSPVTIDTSFVELKLNTDNSVPASGSNLIVMGHGTTYEGGYMTTDLRNVTLPAITNHKCKQSYGSAITNKMLCAGFPDTGAKDACQGDSGGPIVQRTYQNDGSFVDYHVGVVSWGYGCARPGYPGVYARTSKRIDWIRSTACGMGSVASFCPNDPPPFCTTGEELEVAVTTDKYSIDENKWWLTATDSGQKVMERTFLVKDYASTQRVCLEPETCYRWTITDTYGDGITNNGAYKLTLNGKEFASGAGNTIGSIKTADFCIESGKLTTPQPTPAPTPFPTHSLLPTAYDGIGQCGGNGKLQSRIEFTTDYQGGYSGWNLYEYDEDSKGYDAEPVYSGYGYDDHSHYTLPSENEFYCLEFSRRYKFVSDPPFYGDGWFDSDTQTFVSFVLDGSVLATSSGTVPLEHEFYTASASDAPTTAPTPSIDHGNTEGPTASPTASSAGGCENDPGFRFRNSKKKSCGWIGRKKNRNKRKKLCRKKHGEGRVFDYCAKTCGKVGLGECKQAQKGKHGGNTVGIISV